MPLKYEHLLGLEFNIEHQHCYTLVRMFYRDNYGIELTDYACPTNWWRTDLDLYSNLMDPEGFDLLHCHPREYQPGDIIMSAIQSSSGNHLSVVLDTGDILHHLVGQRSCVTPYGGLFRNTTVGVYRHRDVARLPREKHLLDIQEVLPPHVRRRLDEIARNREAAARDAGGTPDA